MVLHVTIATVVGISVHSVHIHVANAYAMPDGTNQHQLGPFAHRDQRVIVQTVLIGARCRRVCRFADGALDSQQTSFSGLVELARRCNR
jgi:hypothetical protein